MGIVNILQNRSAGHLEISHKGGETLKQVMLNFFFLEHFCMEVLCACARGLHRHHPRSQAKPQVFCVYSWSPAAVLTWSTGRPAHSSPSPLGSLPLEDQPQMEHWSGIQKAFPQLFNLARLIWPKIEQGKSQICTWRDFASFYLSSSLNFPEPGFKCQAVGTFQEAVSAP